MYETNRMKNIYFLIIKTLICAVMLVCGLRAEAFPTDVYSGESVLARGKWAKISVETTGMHFIPASTLRSWGFSNPESVRVHGYGGQRISDILSLANYVDDLPMVQSVATSQGVWFYAQGVVSETVNRSGNIEHALNPFSEHGYYFITESNEPERTFESVGKEGATNPATTFRQMVFHEVDKVTYSQTGHALFGESFMENPTIQLKFAMPDRVSDQNLWMKIGVATDGKANCTLTTTANGQSTGSSNIIRSTSVSGWGTEGEFERYFTSEGTDLDMSLNLTRGSGVTNANLDYVTMNYTRQLRMNGGILEFLSNNGQLRLDGVTASTVLWDVTDPLNIKSVNARQDGSSLLWTVSGSGYRRYVAWSESANVPQPKLVGSVANQNLHDESLRPNMIIFTLNDWGRQAERVANIHRYGADSLDVMVVDQQLVFNEFSSGVPDAGAFRRMLKMFYDRGEKNGSPLKYALFFGRPTFDNRVLTDQMRGLNQKFMPTWQTDDGLYDATSFTADQIFAFLNDDSGSNLAREHSNIGVGRIPVRSVSEATNYVDKMISYLEKSNTTSWKNNVMTVADNADRATHMKQADAMGDAMAASTGGKKMDYTKIYLDLYDVVGGVCEEARSKMYRCLEEGTSLWNYIGHGSISSLTGESMLRPTDIERNMFHRNLPVMMAATCTFMRWDGATVSGGEQLAFMRNGGVVAMICPTRTGGITANGYFTAAFGKNVFETDSLGRTKPLGEVLRLMHNDLKDRKNEQGSAVGDANRLRYCLLGDPAMRMNLPTASLKVETIDGETVKADKQLTVKARQNVELTGVALDASGEIINNFNGPLHVTLYDAQRSLTTKGLNYDGTEGAKFTYEDKGQLLFQGRGTVENGKFSIRIAMPSDIADNFRPAQLSMYAHSTANGMEANGVCSEFYVYGLDEDAVNDTIAPSIETMYLNHENFRNGATVNESPMLLAFISDNVGINLSNAGIGHQMTLRLDGRSVYSDVALYYTPSADGSPSGTIAYPIDGLSEGKHTLSLRIWDTSGNSATREVEFNVSSGVEPSIMDIYSDANPATTEANFYIRHDMPDATLNVTFEVFDMMGRRVWTSSVTDRSDMFQSAPIKWDLRSMGGQRVQRGIYIYRAIVKTETSVIRSHAKRIAVTGR